MVLVFHHWMALSLLNSIKSRPFYNYLYIKSSDCNLVGGMGYRTSCLLCALVEFWATRWYVFFRESKAKTVSTVPRCLTWLFSKVLVGANRSWPKIKKTGGFFHCPLVNKLYVTQTSGINWCCSKLHETCFEKQAVINEWNTSILLLDCGWYVEAYILFLTPNCSAMVKIAHFFNSDPLPIFSTLTSNIACIQDWMDMNQLEMNSSNTEFIVFGSKHQLLT